MDDQKLDAVRKVQLAHTPDAVSRCWPVFRELRPELDVDAFMGRWRTQCAEGYVVAFVALEDAVIAVAGFRILNTMAWGKILYLDDLATLEAFRGQGYGSVLLDWLKAHARAQACDAMHLDTGYHRHGAHKVYLRHGFQLNAHHLAWNARAPQSVVRRP